MNTFAVAVGVTQAGILGYVAWKCHTALEDNSKAFRAIEFWALVVVFAVADIVAAVVHLLRQSGW